ncbi:MAG: copper chaperone PCu(A)C [Burkholderiaceae bacterium]
MNTLFAKRSRPSLLRTAGAALAALALATGPAAWAQPAAPSLLQVDGAWVRPTVPGQKGTGAFMRITAKEGMKLVGASSPAAGVTEVHEMKMEGNVMRMRAIDALDLPAGQAVELKPGGYHVMLMDLKAALPKDTTVPLTLIVRDARGVQQRVELNVPVLSAPPPATPGASGATGAAPMSHGSHKH